VAIQWPINFRPFSCDMEKGFFMPKTRNDSNNRLNI
jgi:hypothetical protein